MYMLQLMPCVLPSRFPGVWISYVVYLDRRHNIGKRRLARLLQAVLHMCLSMTFRYVVVGVFYPTAAFYASIVKNEGVPPAQRMVALAHLWHDTSACCMGNLEGEGLRYDGLNVVRLWYKHESDILKKCTDANSE
jgi:hypothetical protein